MKISEKQIKIMMHYLAQIIQVKTIDKKTKKDIGMFLDEVIKQQSTELKEVE